MNERAPAVHTTDDAGAASAPRPAHGGMAALFTPHILRDGEIVILARKPSLWFIGLQSLWFGGIAILAALGLTLTQGQVDLFRTRIYFEAAIFLMVCRLMWATLQWMGRLYVLTNLRVLRLSGVFYTEVLDCPLRKIADVRLAATIRERGLGLGSIVFVPGDEGRPAGVWQTVAKPRELHGQIVEAINKAKS